MKDFKLLIDNNNFDGIVVVLDNHFNIEKANDAFLSLLNYKEEDIINKPLVDLIVPDEKSLFLDMAYKKDISNYVSLKFYHKSGAFRFFSITLLNFNNHRVVVGNPIKKEYFTDAYHHLNDFLVNINKLFKNIESENIRDFISFSDNSVVLLLNILPLEVWVKDKFGKYIFANEKYTTATGILSEDFFMKDDFQLFDNDTARAFLASDHQAIDSKKMISYSFETDSKIFKGFAEVTKIPIFNKDGKYIGILGFSIDTTHLKSVERELLEETKRLKYYVENTDGLVFEINSSGDVVYLSGRLAEILHFDKLEDKSINLFTFEHSTAELKEKLTLALKGIESSVIANISGVYIEFKFNPIKNEDGSYRIIGYGSVVKRESETHE